MTKQTKIGSTDSDFCKLVPSMCGGIIPGSVSQKMWMAQCWDKLIGDSTGSPRLITIIEPGNYNRKS